MCWKTTGSLKWLKPAVCELGICLLFILKDARKWKEKCGELWGAGLNVKFVSINAWQRQVL